MGRKAYSQTAKAEAVALGAVVGAEEAGRRLGITAGAVRNWMGKAGRLPADAISSSSWASLGALARSQVAADLVAGRVKPTQAAIIAGIAERNATKPEPPPDPETAEKLALDARLRELSKDERHDLSLVLVALLRAPEPPDDPVAYIAALVAEHGSLEAWRAWLRVQDDEARAVQMAKNRAAAASAAQQVLDAETRDLLAAAETWIREHPE